MAHPKMKSCGIMACALTFAFAGGADASIAYFDLADTEYGSAGFSVIGSFQTNAGGAEVTGFTIEQGVLQTYDNGGLPNWASEAILGISVVLPSGEESIYLHLPFAETDGSGTYGPVDIQIDLSGGGYLVPEDGFITAYAISSWDDGTDQSAGIWLQGDLNVNYLPGPASLAFLALAGMASRRRRRDS